MADLKRYSTPPGIAVFPRLANPDTKYNELGTYKADLALDADADSTQPFMAAMLADYKEHTGKAHPKNPDKGNRDAFYYTETDDEGEYTGRIVLKLRVSNKLVKKTGKVWERKPRQFDAFLKPIEVNPWGGSKMIVSFEVYAWSGKDNSKGFSLQPIGVQIIDLISGEGPDASDMGFSAQEGYASPDLGDSMVPMMEAPGDAETAGDY